MLTHPSDILRLLADTTRLRILALLGIEELSVAELQEILEMGQSRISTHLAQLRQAGLVLDRKEGKRTYYMANPRPPAPARALCPAVLETMQDAPEAPRDRAELSRVLARRRQIAERYFDEVAGRLGKNYCPGRSWESIGHFLLHLTPALTIADLGAGEGVLAQLLARRAQTVYCIDNSPRMVEVGAGLAKRHQMTNVVYKLGDIEAVPLPDGSVDLAYLSQALHHAQHPPRAVAEAYRILRPGGQLLILDLKEHSFEKARELYADLWLGFREASLHGFLREAGFQKVEVCSVARETAEPCFETLLASGVKP